MKKGKIFSEKQKEVLRKKIEKDELVMKALIKGVEKSRNREKIYDKALDIQIELENAGFVIRRRNK